MMHTALLEAHQALGGKIVNFCGWQMPVQYQGVILEHQTVRQHVGIFDVSHMGRILVEGLEAEALLDFLSTNQISDKKDGTATYTVWCNEQGMAVDDLIVYRESKTKFFLIVNAGNREKDLAHLLHYSQGRDVTINERYQEDGILAVQGPQALNLMAVLFPGVRHLKHMHFASFTYKNQAIVISKTGYTGEDGVEIYAPKALSVDLWHALLEKGKPFGIAPIGLGARDTLRLEMGYALYGHELSDTIMPIESVSAWTVKWGKSNFLGKSALELMRDKPHRHEYGIVLSDKGVAREGYRVLQEGKQIGMVTSGTHSPTLNQAIAIVLVEKKLEEGDSVEVQIREHLCAARVVNLPFIQIS
jgi:aminomethyltransferase